MEHKHNNESVLALSPQGRSRFNNLLMDLPKEQLLKVILVLSESDEIRTADNAVMWVWGDFDRKLHDRGIKIFWNEVLPRLRHSEYLLLRRLDSGLCQEYGSYHRNPFNLRFNLRLKASISFEEAV